MSKLRSLFTDLGRGRKVNELLDVDNPASNPSIRQYLACIREEQAEARVTPTQATPFFYEKKDRKLKRFPSSPKYPNTSSRTTLENETAIS